MARFFARGHGLIFRGIRVVQETLLYRNHGATLSAGPAHLGHGLIFFAGRARLGHGLILFSHEPGWGRGKIFARGHGLIFRGIQVVQQTLLYRNYCAVLSAGPAHLGHGLIFISQSGLG